MRVCWAAFFLFVLSPFGLCQTALKNPQSKTPPQCTIQGTVIGVDTGQPLRKADVSLEKTGGRAEPQDALTDSSGQFEIQGIDSGRYSLSACHATYVCMDYQQRSVDTPGSVLTLTPGQVLKKISFRLPRAAAISGYVYDENGDPVERAQVMASRYRYFRGKRQMLPANIERTDDRGKYRIFDLAPGQYYVSASFNSGQFGNGPASLSYPKTFYPSTTDPSSASPVLLTAGNDYTDVNISLIPTQTFHIRGKVFNAVANRPGKGSNVVLVPRSGQAATFFPFLNQSYVRDAQGAFDLGGVRPGSYFVVASDGDSGTELTTRVPVDVTNADVNGMTLTLTSGISISGTVKAEGGKFDFAGIRAQLTPRGQRFYFGGGDAPINSDDTFAFRHVGDGGYKVQVWRLPQDAYIKSVLLNGQDVRISGLDVSGGQDPGTLQVVIEANGGRVEGTVTKDDKAFNGARVVLLPENAASANDYDDTQDARTDQYGRFVIRGIRPGNYQVMAFEQIERGAWTDPNFMSRMKGKGKEVEVSDGAVERVELQVIPGDQAGGGSASE